MAKIGAEGSDLILERLDLLAPRAGRVENRLRGNKGRAFKYLGSAMSQRKVVGHKGDEGKLRPTSALTAMSAARFESIFSRLRSFHTTSHMPTSIAR